MRRRACEHLSLPAISFVGLVITVFAVVVTSGICWHYRKLSRGAEMVEIGGVAHIAGESKSQAGG
jgi:hypothetical protein